MGILALLWGSSFLWIKFALQAMSPGQIAIGRILLGAAVLVVLCYSGRQRLPKDRKIWAHLVFAAFFGNALPFFLFGFGEETVDSGIAGVLNATTPLWALLIGVLIRQERKLFSLRMLGMVVGFAGTLLIFAPWQAGGLTSWGALAILGAAASYAVSYTYIGLKLSGKGTAPIALSAAQLVTASGLSMLLLPIDGFEPITLSPLGVIAVVILGVFGTGFAFALNYRLIADEGAVAATAVGYLLPVVSVLLGAVVLGEPVTARVVVGMVVVLLGVGMTRWQPKAVASPELVVPATPQSAVATPERAAQ
ncbi:DMT family transporter [Kibdelosporangium philippinense]|uniref:DMT family transporter n=2 Tax=Kibdelosporangium philippinense TaxID=211113 RepID=A0ABS8ZDR7_9PSEU|nr:DMT family transporter [Kibdelosporangium philippinense]MCE7005989.1 DMT family transporter [Kibdelosporangium philippinense]